MDLLWSFAWLAFLDFVDTLARISQIGMMAASWVLLEATGTEQYRGPRSQKNVKSNGCDGRYGLEAEF